MTDAMHAARYSVAEVAALLKVDRSTVYRMISAGRFGDVERHGVHGTIIRITASGLAAYLSGTAA